MLRVMGTRVTPAGSSAGLQQVIEALADVMGELGIPGAAVGILADGREEHGTFGVARLTSRRPITPETLFPIGSVSKTYTATAIWRLIETGALELEAPVRRYLPDLRVRDEQASATVTVGDLLSHSAGWFGDHLFDDGDDDDVLARYVEQRLPAEPQLFPCRTAFSYNNSGFTVLGRLIEVASGLTYDEAMRQLVLDPLGLSDTLIERSAVLNRCYVDGHTAMPVNGQDAVLVQTPAWLPRCVGPAGGIWSTTRDVMRYARMHLGDSTPAYQLLGPNSRKAMQEPAFPVPGLTLQMGRSWFLEEVCGHRVISHNGDTPGHHAVLLAVPELEFAFVALLNGQPGAKAALAALDVALTTYPGLSDLSGRVGLMRALLAPSPLEGMKLSADQLHDYAGQYTDPGQTTTFQVDGDSLMMTFELTPAPGSWRPPFAPPPAEPVPVVFEAPDRGVVGGIRIAFVRNDNGEIGWMMEGLRLRPRA